MQGAIAENHFETCCEPQFQLLSMDFRGHFDYTIIFWTGELDDKRLVLQSVVKGIRGDPLMIHSAMVMNDKRDTIFACADHNSSGVSLFKLSGKSIYYWFIIKNELLKCC